MTPHRWPVLLALVIAVFGFASCARAAPKPSPMPVSQGAWFPTVSARPQANPMKILFSVGSHSAVVDIELLDNVNGMEVCLQRSFSTPKDVSAWSLCTYYYKHAGSGPSAVYAFNITDVEGNVPYYVNLRVLDANPHMISSAKLYVTIDQCALGTTRSLHHPDQCVPVIPLSTNAHAPFTVPASSAQTSFYYTVNAPNNNAHEIVTGFTVTLSLPAEATSWQLYGAANMPPMLDSYDFLGVSTTPEFSKGVVKIVTPSPGVWYLTLVVDSTHANPEYNGTISRIVTITPESKIGPEIPLNNRLIVGPPPAENNPRYLKYFTAHSRDGSLYVSLSLLNPRTKDDGNNHLPYRLFVAANAVPGSFNSSVGFEGANVFADWTGCSLGPSQCNYTTIIQMPPTGLEVTYIVGVLPIGNFSGTRFALWRDSVCPFCERGVCQTKGPATGSCKCPKGWTQINCGVWGEKHLTPQIIVIIALMSIFAVCGVCILVYVIYSKRARLFPSKFGPEANGYDHLSSAESHINSGDAPFLRD